ncbi:MAG: hypothetical protein J6M46_08775 [Lachnospiraceae bacterium]|nr:hypothetical protein [Lachnospiraceae bacterium]
MIRITTGSMMHVHGALGTGCDYTVRLSVRMTDPVDAQILEQALRQTQEAFPVFCIRLRENAQDYFYEENPLPVVLLHQSEKSCLNCEKTHFHLWAVCYDEDWIHLDIFHGMTDGTGMYQVLATLLYYYCAARYGIPAQADLNTVESPAGAERRVDPQDVLSPDTLPEDLLRIAQKPVGNAFTLETDGGLTTRDGSIICDIEIPEDAFIRFTSAHDASPGTMVSLLLARAIDDLYPEREKKIISAYVVNARPMLNAQATLANCLSMAFFPYEDRIRQMPLTEQCTIYRGMTFLQSDPGCVLPSVAGSAEAIRAAAEAAPTLEEKKKTFSAMFNGGEGLITYLVSYTGKWKYADIGKYMCEFWTHAPNTFGLTVQIGAAGGKIFLSIQQRFEEDSICRAFLSQLKQNGIPYVVRWEMMSDVAVFTTGCE